MLRSSLDRAFARYARTGEPEALARVFDGCANELYRIGFHLLGDRHAAEDLVQQTFVVAIEHAKGFDRSRRVLPWLCGILTNRALLARRQQRTRAAAAARGPVRDDVIDPMAQSAANEVTERIAATVRALPEPYHQVLLLHLVHELAPQEIAEARDGLAEGQLPAGRWRVASRGATTMAAIEVDLQAGARTVTTLRIPAGVPFALRVPERARERPDWRLHWRDATGSLLRSGSVPHRETGTDHPMRAAAGRYTLELVDAQGVQASTTFDLRDDDPARVVEMPLPQE